MSELNNMSNLNVISADKVKAFRLDNGWSQELLAKASGLSLRTIQRLEKEGGGSAETQLALAATFNISPKELFVVSSTLDVNWKRKNIMQSAFAMSIVIGVIVMLITLAGGFDPNIYFDAASALFLLLFIYGATVIAFGAHGMTKSMLGLKYLFSNEIADTPASQYLGVILTKQIYFAYGGAFIAVLIGSIAIHSNVSGTIIFHRSYAVNLLVVLYASILAEGILRPLAAKLEKRNNN